jgi:phosphoesterase RecJ-like protein
VHVLLEYYGEKYNILPGQHLVYSNIPNKLKPDVFIALDCGDADRLGEARDLFKRAKSLNMITVCIDHHETNSGFAQYDYIDGAASSACEMVYNLLEPMLELDENIASALYAGIVYDTGGFRHSSAKPETYAIASRLIAKGIPFTKIYNAILHTNSYSAAKIMGRALNEAKLRMDGKIVCACVTYEMMREVNADVTDLDGIVEYLMNVKGAKVAVLIYERQGPSGELPEVKISFRSRGIRVDHIAQRLGGGGHQYASGCTVYGDIHTVTEQALDILEKELALHA